MCKVNEAVADIIEKSVALKNGGHIQIRRNELVCCDLYFKEGLIYNSYGKEEISKFLTDEVKSDDKYSIDGRNVKYILYI